LDSSWYVKDFSQSATVDHELVTFIRIRPQTVYQGFGLDPSRKFYPEQEIELDHSFHISSREISASLFFKFVNSLPKDDPTRTKLEKESRGLREIPGDCPIAGISWLEAARFCNWLSLRDRLKPCYFETEELQGDSLYPWSRDSTCNGYRLPTPLEWEAAHRGKTKTRYSFGNSLSRLNQHTITSIHPELYSKSKVARRGLKMPNNFGLFDTNGNTSEWCDTKSDSPEVLLRGGNSTEMTRYFQSSSYQKFTFDNQPDYMTSNSACGFRIVLEID
jgi:formylglycine-generating enzyme required for sulfatase activity